MQGVITITYGGQEKTAAAWGLNAAPRIETRDRSPTKFHFRMAGADPQTGPPFKFFPAEIKAGSTPAAAEVACRVVVKQYSAWTGGTGWSGLLWQFTGYLSHQPGHVSGKEQSIKITLSDAIWLLQNTTFQQLWKIASTPGSPAYISRCVLFMDINSWVPNQYMSVQWQLQQIVTYAASCGIRISIGTIDYSDWFLNYAHTQAVSCWDALLRCLAPIPDAKVWVDGSAAIPTLNIRRRSSIAALATPSGTGPGPITLPWRGKDAAGRAHTSSESFEPRHDLCPPQVVLQYQINNTFDGKAAPTWTNDVYPATVGGLADGQMPFAMVCPIDLSGGAIITQTGQMDCEPLACVGGSHASKRIWWAGARGGVQPKLADYRVRFGVYELPDAVITNAAGVDITATVLANYPRRMVGGAHHAWMKIGTTQINAIKVHVKAKTQFAEYDVAGSGETDTAHNMLKKSNSHELHYEMTVTNAPAGLTNFVGSDLTAYAESPVANLAQNIYTSRATLDYDGDHEIVDPGLPGTSPPLKQLIGHWNVLNLSGGLAAWATANMTIAGTDIDLQTNHIRISVGPAKHLAPQDWSEMLQFFRYRYLYCDSSSRATGYGGANNTVDMARNTPDGNTAPGLEELNFTGVQGDYTAPF